MGLRCLVLAGVLAVCTSATAREARVDVALVLAADVSSSMTRTEVQLQRSGYASALRSPRVLDAIRSGAHGRIAVAYVEWSGEGAATVAVDWTTLEDAATVEALAHRIQSFVPGPVKARRAGRTSISYGIRFSLSLFDKQISVAERRVIDVSGDGENNDGEDVTSARDAAVRAGVTINGLAMGDEATEGETIADYYAREVVAGAGSFVEAVDDLRGFAHAMERKLWREIAAEPAASTTKVALGIPNPSGRTAMLLLRRDRAVPWMPF